jgi:hypothetical protein
MMFLVYFFILLMLIGITQECWDRYGYAQMFAILTMAWFLFIMIKIFILIFTELGKTL